MNPYWHGSYYHDWYYCGSYYLEPILTRIILLWTVDQQINKSTPWDNHITSVKYYHQPMLPETIVATDQCYYEWQFLLTVSPQISIFQWTRLITDVMAVSGKMLSLGLRNILWLEQLLVGCLTSQQYASVSQGRICSDDGTSCHSEIEVADQTFYLTQSQYTDTWPTSPCTDPILPDAWQGSHWSGNFYVTGLRQLWTRKIPTAQTVFEHWIIHSWGGHFND